ncbi:BTB/POZ domain-containing protein SR1IP1-like [Telopea speciosissima]|uniref:BTB/POZ domain-containing protein SR1IP1-like n=1 Tax=Telopea speciosissima TaxID=54955 RepID=UPI001CC35964|nr:BTB/POZ domain-containing protein SR1IP1-like [Telopea speciosissima]
MCSGDSSLKKTQTVLAFWFPSCGNQRVSLLWEESMEMESSVQVTMELRLMGERRDQSWYVATDIPSDVLVQVRDVSFHLHKHPLLSQSGKMNRIIYESRDADLNMIVLDDLPGGADAFELAAKFCSGIAIDQKDANIAGLRMTYKDSIKVSFNHYFVLDQMNILENLLVLEFCYHFIVTAAEKYTNKRFGKLNLSNENCK